MALERELYSMLIYAVDDDSINLKLIHSVLDQAGFQKLRLFFSSDDMLKEMDTSIPDLILLDIMMPGKSGYNTLEILKTNSKFKHIPVIMITAIQLGEDMEPLRKSFELGAMDYISKPFTPIELTMRVKSALKLEKARKDLELALTRVRSLETLLPICSYCKKIRSDESYWEEVEVYISDHTDTMFSHSICPDCYNKYVKPQLNTLKNKNNS